MTLNVLIVDDSKLARALLRRFTEQKGYHVIGEAVDGLDGFKQYQALQPDLILCDIEMPKFNGVRLLKKIRETDKKIPFIIVSSVANSQLTQEATSLGATVIQKPVTEKVIIDALNIID